MSASKVPFSLRGTMTCNVVTARRRRRVQRRFFSTAWNPAFGVHRALRFYVGGLWSSASGSGHRSAIASSLEVYSEASSALLNFVNTHSCLVTKPWLHISHSSVIGRINSHQLVRNFEVSATIIITSSTLIATMEQAMHVRKEGANVRHKCDSASAFDGTIWHQKMHVICATVH